jgi:hypothetical protein
VFSKNPQAIEAITLESVGANGETTFVVRRDGTDHRIVAASGTWKKTTMSGRGAPEPVAASGAWTAPDTYTLTVTRSRTPFSTTFRLRFGGHLLAVRSENNIGPADARVAEFIGEAQTPSTRSSR